MSLFGSAKSAKIADIEVALASTNDGGIKLFVNGVFYGMARKGKTVDEDVIAVNRSLLNEAVSENVRTEVFVGLMSVLSGDAPERITELIAKFRKSKCGR